MESSIRWSRWRLCQTSGLASGVDTGTHASETSAAPSDGTPGQGLAQGPRSSGTAASNGSSG